MNGSKHFDPQLGIDFHTYVLPPCPLPTPHISLVFDMFDYLPLIGATVKIHGLKRTVAGTSGKVIHIPLGVWAPPLMVPMGPQKDDELFMGSSTVIVDGDPLTYRCLPTLSCNIAGLPAPFRPRQKSKPLPRALSLPLTANIALPHNVHVGGSPTVSLMAMAMKVGFAGLRRLKNSGRFKNAMARFKAFRQRLFYNMDSGFLKCKILRAEPVDIRDRSVSLSQRDFTVAGRLPLDWLRHYRSSNMDDSGLCGRGWRTLIDTTLSYYPDEESWLLELADGPLCFLATPTAPGRQQAVYGVPAGLLWYEEQQGEQTHWLIELDGLIYRFTESRAAVGNERTLSLSALEDRNGNQWQFVYAQQQLTTLVEANQQGLTGREIRVTIQQQRLVAMHLSDSQHPDEGEYELVVYEYDEHRQLHHHLDRDGHGRQFLYHDQYYLASHGDRLGQTFYYQYDENHAVVRAWGDDGLYDYQFNWTEECLELAVINSLGDTSIIRFGEEGLPLCEIDPQGNGIFFAYDDWGRTIQVTESGNRVTQWQYDDAGNVVNEFRNGELAFAVTYDDNLPVSFTDAAGAQWRYDYDRYGNPAVFTDPLNISRQYRYNEFGQLSTVLHPNGSRESFTYNRLGFLISRTNPAGQRTNYAVDGRSNLLQETNPLGHVTHYRYDNKDRLVQVNRHQQQPIYLAYDAEDQLIAYRDEAGQETQLTYNGTGEVTGCRTPDGGWVRYHYDTEDQLIAVENQRQQRWQLKRDSLGQIIEEVDYWGQSRHYQYDQYHDMVACRDALGSTVNFKYDKQGQVIEKQHNDSPTARYEYNARGQLISCSNPWRKLVWAYDNGGRLTKELQDGLAIQHHYHASGQYRGRVSDLGNQVLLDYNAAGQVSQIQINQQPAVTLEYDALGRLKQETLSESLHRELDYNVQHQLTAQRVLRDNQPLFETAYQYDNVGNLTERQDSLWGVDSYGYDAVGRLTHHTDPLGKIKAFVYDAAGNRLQDVIQQRYPEQSEDSGLYRDSQLEGIHYTYDQAGQLVKRQAVDDKNSAEQFSWNENQQLTRYQKNGQTTEYTYDGLGRRVYKKTAERIDWYFWLGDALFAEASQPIEFVMEPDSGTDISQPQRFILMNSERFRVQQLQLLLPELREYVYYPNSFIPLALIDVKEQQKQVYYYHNDINGAPLRLTDANGEIVWSEKSGVWGEQGTVYANLVANPLRFQGQYFDEESGLHYNRHRYFCPVTGCFISQDPIGLEGGLNPYRYAPNALGWIDPLGLRKCTSGFSSADDAGRAALLKYNPMSIFKNREYGGIIYRAKDGSYGYTRGRLGTGRTAPTFKESSKGLPKGAEPVGQYHTHGDYSDSSFNRTNKAGDAQGSDIFSDADIRIHNDANNTFPGYTDVLGTPSGEFWKISGRVSGPTDAIPL